MIWPKWYSNQQLRTAYEQKFTYYGYDYRMSLIQIRQVRSGGKHLLSFICVIQNGTYS